MYDPIDDIWPPPRARPSAKERRKAWAAINEVIKEWRNEMKPPIKPISNYVIVEEDTPPLHSTEGGIITPEILERDHYEGEVVAVGPGYMKRKKGKYRRRPVSVKEGDWVVVPKNKGHLVRIDGRYYWFVRESDILWVENDEDA